MTRFTPPNAVTWFEIPASDGKRASNFYETVLATTLIPEAFGAFAYHKFPYEETGISGCIIGAPHLAPGRAGTMIYLACPDLDGALARVADAGGGVLSQPILLPEGMGRIAQIVDSEGNYVGLHQA